MIRYSDFVESPVKVTKACKPGRVVYDREAQRVEGETFCVGETPTDEPAYVGSDRIDWSAGTTPASTIVRRLGFARDWLPIAQDDDVVREIVAACIFLLRQSCRKYGDWVQRYRAAARKLDRTAVRKLVELTISDVEASPWNYEIPWQLEQFAAGKLIAEAKQAASCICAGCERTFYPSRKVKYCSTVCRNKASYKRRKSRKSASKVSDAA
jgi:hypothetical protein